MKFHREYGFAIHHAAPILIRSTTR